MTTSVQPIAVPFQLEDWRPACDLFDDSGSHTADYALLWHDRCMVFLTCEKCLSRLRDKLHWFLSDYSPETHDLVCDGCSSRVTDPYSCIHLEPI